MTRVPARRDGAVPWLMGQAVLFGAMAAVLGVVANALFLDTYGAEWLPVTYILIGGAGIVISGVIARASQRVDLLRMAVAVLGAAALGFAASWGVARGPGGAWVSAPLLVLFPILIQLGFVFIGGQAGRILDIAGIKASFPRVMAGFPLGAVLGGLVAVPLVDLTARTEDLLLATAVLQGSFAALVWATGRRYRSVLVLPIEQTTTAPVAAEAADGDRHGTLRGLFRSPFVALILAYQLLSALGSQVSDYLVFDRATAAYPSADELARFLGGYTAVMNAVSIAFLFLVAGPLLRRFGLRLGIAANPLVLTSLAVATGLAWAGTGGASMALLAVVSAARIADIALTDGTTRTSINAMYQVLPARPRIVVQTAVEGIAVPVAIGVSGVLILLLNQLPDALPATIGVLLAVCAGWTWVGLRLYGAYGPALIDVLRGRREMDPDAAFEATLEDVAAARRLIAASDARSARFGLELAGSMDMPGLAPELASLARDPRSDVRVAALGALAGTGDEWARQQLATEVLDAMRSDDVPTRLQAAQAAGALDAAGREAAAGLLSDGSLEVRHAALEFVHAGDAFALDAVLAAIRDPRLASSGMRAFGRLGDAAAPALLAALDDPDPSMVPIAARLLRGLSTPGPVRAEILRRHIAHPDRALGLLVLERLGEAGALDDQTGEALAAGMRQDAAHAVRVLGALAALEARPGGGDGAPLVRALGEELDLLAKRVIAAITAKYGRERLGQAFARLAGGGDGFAIALEAIEVVAGADEARLIATLLDTAGDARERLAVLGRHWGRPAQRDMAGLLRDVIEDPDGVWRSPWLRACGLRAMRLGELGPFEGSDTSVALDARPDQQDRIVEEELELLAVARRVRSAGAPP